MVQSQPSPDRLRIVHPAGTADEEQRAFRPSFTPQEFGVGFQPQSPPLTPPSSPLQTQRSTTVQPSQLRQQSGVSQRSLISPGSETERVEEKQNILSRFGSGLRGVADWLQTWVDGPIPGMLGMTAGLVSRTDKSPVHALADSIDFLFTGANEYVQAQLRREGVSIPVMTGNVVKDRLASWKAFGEWQRERPEFYWWDKKLLEELLFSPLNLTLLGPGGKAARAADNPSLWTRITRKMAWSESRANPLRMTLRSRRAVSETYAHDTLGLTMDLPDPMTGTALRGLPESQGLSEMRRRLGAFYDGGDEIKSIWGGEFADFRVQKTLENMRKAFPTKGEFETWLREDAPRDPIGLLLDMEKTIGQAAAGLTFRTTKSGKVVAVTRGANVNPIMRAQQKLKREMSPFLLSGTLRYPIYNSVNAVTQLLWRHNFRILQIPSSVRFSEKLGILDPGGLGRSRLLRSEISGSLQDITKEAGRAISGVQEWKPFAARIPGFGWFIRGSMRLSAIGAKVKDVPIVFGDEVARESALGLTAQKVWHSEWKRAVDDIGLPPEARNRLLSAVSTDDVESALRELSGEAAPRAAPDVTSLGQFGRTFWDDALEQYGRPISSIDDMRFVEQRTRDALAKHYDEVIDEARINSADIRQSSEGLYDVMVKDLEQLGGLKGVAPEVRNAVKAEVSALKEEKSAFAQRWLKAGNDIQAAERRAQQAAEVVHSRAWTELMERVDEVRVLGRMRDLRQIQSYYKRLVRVPAEEAAARLPDLRRWNAAQREKIFNEFTGRIKRQYDEFADALESIPADARSGIGLGDLNMPTVLPRDTLRKIMDEVGLDAKIYDPDSAPDVVALITKQKESEIAKLRAMRGQAEAEARRTAQRGVREGGALAPEQAELIRRAHNTARAKTQRVALRTVEQDFFDYGNRNYIDYAMNHLMPYPFWATRYMTYWASRTLTNPTQARVALRVISEWQKAMEDEPPHLRFSVKIVTLPGGTEVRVSPWGALMPLAYPLMDVMTPGRETNDVVQAAARIQDFAGGYFYPTVELLGAAMGSVFPSLDMVRSGGRGIVRSPKEIMLDFIPQMSLGITGVNGFGYDAVTGAARDSFISDQQKNAILFSISDDLNTGRLTDEDAARQAIESIRAGQPNALAAAYARKALSKSLFSKATGLLGLPMRLVTPGEKVTADARRRLIPEPGAVPPPPDEVDALYRQFPGLEITGGKTVPSGFSREQAQLYQATTDYWEANRRLRDQRDRELQAAWQRFRNAASPLTGEQYRRQRSDTLRNYAAATEGALTRTVQQVAASGVPLDDLPLPIVRDASGQWAARASDTSLGRDRRNAFWMKTGRPSYPDNPLNIVEDGYYSIDADQFTDPLTGIIDWSAFFAARQVYENQLEDGEYEWLQARIQSKDSVDKGFRMAQEAVRPYYQLRDALMARDPEVERLLTEQSIAIKNGDLQTARRLGRHPRIRIFERRLERDRTALRRRNPVVDAALIAFYGLTRPVHRDWFAIAEREFFNV